MEAPVSIVAVIAIVIVHVCSPQSCSLQLTGWPIPVGLPRQRPTRVMRVGGCPMQDSTILIRSINELVRMESLSDGEDSWIPHSTVLGDSQQRVLQQASTTVGKETPAPLLPSLALSPSTLSTSLLNLSSTWKKSASFDVVWLSGVLSRDVPLYCHQTKRKRCKNGQR